MPGLFTMPAVALLKIALRTVADVALGLPCKYSATTPTTCGVAIDVPLKTAVAELLLYHAEVMLTPGAKISTQVP